MNLNKFILLILILLLINNVYGLIISPETQSTTIYSTDAINLYLNLTNNLNESIYLLSLSTSNPDISFIENHFNMSINETKIVKLVLDTSTSYQNTSKINVIFYRKSEILLEPSDTNIIITNYQYLPIEQKIILGSKVKWTNNDTIKHSVTSSLFDHEILPSESFEYTFNIVGITEYYDKFTNYFGKIIIQVQSFLLIHLKEQLDQPWNLRLFLM